MWYNVKAGKINLFNHMFRYRFKIIAAIIVVLALISIAAYQSGQLAGFSAGNISKYSSSTAGLLAVYFFDVGQGDGALAITPDGQDIVIDGGPDNTMITKLGERLPYYDHQIELLIVSHPHSDHVTGLVEILKRYQVKQIIMTGVVHTAPDYLDFLRLVRDKKIPVKIIDQPQDLPVGDKVDLSFLWPSESMAEKTVNNLNNSSIVFKMIYASTSMLFMGDLEEEEKLASTTPAETLRSDVLKVGHHGSSNANSALFLRLVSPWYAVISVSADNDYGHPHYRTIVNLEKTGAQIWRTDQQGDIVILSDGQKVWKQNN